MSEETDLFESLMEDASTSDARQEIIDLVEPLRAELNLIRDKGLKEFVSLMLANSPFIWTSPSSDQEDVYPPDEYETGGIIKHIQRTVRAAFVLATVYPLSDEDIQTLLAAAILHCIVKPMLPNDDVDPFIPKLYDNHYQISFDTFIQNALEVELSSNRLSRGVIELDQDIIDRIARLVHCCEGTFSPIPEVFPQDPLEILMASANIVAKSVHLIIDGSEIRDERWFLPTA